MGKRHNRNANRLMNSFSNLASFSDKASTISTSNALTTSETSIDGYSTVDQPDGQLVLKDFNNEERSTAEANLMQGVAIISDTNDVSLEDNKQQVILEGSTAALTASTDTLNIFNSYPLFAINEQTKHLGFIPNQGDTNIYSSEEDDWFFSLLFDMDTEDQVAEVNMVPPGEVIDHDDCSEITEFRSDFDDIGVLIDYIEGKVPVRSSYLSAADTLQVVPTKISTCVNTVLDDLQSYSTSQWPTGLQDRITTLSKSSDVGEMVSIHHKKAILDSEQKHLSRTMDHKDPTNGDYNLTNVFRVVADNPSDLSLHQYSKAHYTVYLQLQTHYGAPRRSTIDDKLTYYVTHHTLSELKRTIPILQSQIEIVIPILFNLDMHFEGIIDNLSRISGHNAFSATNVFKDNIKTLGYVLHRFLNDPFVCTHAEAHFPTVESFEHFTNNLQNVNVPFSAFFLMLLRVYHFSEVYTNFIQVAKGFYKMSRQSRTRDSHVNNPHLLEVSRDIYSRHICEILKGIDDAVSFLGMDLSLTPRSRPYINTESDTISTMVVMRLKQGLAYQEARLTSPVDPTAGKSPYPKVSNPACDDHIQQIALLRFTGANHIQVSEYFLSVYEQLHVDELAAYYTEDEIRIFLIYLYITHYTFGAHAYENMVTKISNPAVPIMDLPPEALPELLATRETVEHRRHNSHTIPHITQRGIATLIVYAYFDYKLAKANTTAILPTPYKRPLFNGLASSMGYKPVELHNQLTELFRNFGVCDSKLFLILSFDNVYPCDYMAFVHGLLALYSNLDLDLFNDRDLYALQITFPTLITGIFPALEPHTDAAIQSFTTNYRSLFPFFTSNLEGLFLYDNNNLHRFPGGLKCLRNESLIQYSYDANNTKPLPIRHLQLTGMVFKPKLLRKILQEFNDDNIQAPPLPTPLTGIPTFQTDSTINITPTSDDESPTYPEYSPISTISPTPTTSDLVQLPVVHVLSMLSTMAPSITNISSNSNQQQPFSSDSTDIFLTSMLDSQPSPTLKRKDNPTSLSPSYPSDEEGTTIQPTAVCLDTIEGYNKRARSDSEGRQR